MDSATPSVPPKSIPEFPCSGCGLCCKLLPRHKPGWPLRGDGACKHLTVDNRCSIYDTRPAECRINAMHQEVAPSLSTWKYHDLTAMICNTMMDQEGTPPDRRVKIGPEETYGK
jgi:Fe-S-cluster containining protein